MSHSRSLIAATTPLPSNLGKDEIGLKTRGEFLDHRNPTEKFHMEESYDWDVETLNQDHSIRHVATTSGFRGNKFDIYRTGDPNGFLLRDEEGELAGVIAFGVMYYSHPALVERLPTSFAGFRGRGPTTDMGVRTWKRVKYLSEVLPLVSDKISQNYAAYPVLLQRLRLRGQEYTLRAEKQPVPDKGTTLGILDGEGSVVAQASNEWGATLLAVAQEYRGRGLGKVLGDAWYKFNPSFTSGGFTPGGQANAVRMWESRVRKFLSNGWYSELVRSGKMSSKQVAEILAGIGERRKEREDIPTKKRGEILIYAEDYTFIVYDERFLEDPQAEDAEKYLHGFGFFRDATVGSFLYTIDYDRPYAKLTTTVALQMARDEGEPIYVGKGYGDIVEWANVPDVSQNGDFISLDKDVLPLRALSAKERRQRKAGDPYGEAKVLLLERSEMKWR